MPYADGTFTNFKQVGPTRVSYPFIDYPTKNTICKRYDVTGWVLPGSYTPAAPLSTYPGDGIFAASNVHYLVEETQPRDGGGYYIVDRSYCNIPGNQVRWGSQMIVRPSMHDVVSGSNYGVSFDDGETTHIFTSRIAVSSVGVVEGAETTESALPSGTVTIQLDNYSTWNFSTAETAPTISAVLNSLGLTCTVVTTPAAISIVVDSASARKIMYCYTATSGISIQGNDMGFTVSAGSSTETVVKTRVIATGSAHSGSAGGWVAFWNGSRVVATVKAVAASGSSITVPAGEGALALESPAITHCAFATQASRRVVNGPAPVSTRITEMFYMPGVSGGITTPADITLYDSELNPVSWLAAVAANNTYAVIDGSDLAPWLGPIYRLTKTEAQMSDAVVTVAVGA